MSKFIKLTVASREGIYMEEYFNMSTCMCFRAIDPNETTPSNAREAKSMLEWATGLFYSTESVDQILKLINEQGE